MKLVGKVPVEPLDDERLTNIERNLVVRVSEMSQQHVRAPRRLLAFAGMAAALAVAVFVGWKLHRDPTLPAAKAEQFAMKAGSLDLGDAQITGADFDVTRTAARTDIVMKPGKLELHVEHRADRLFVVRAGDVVIEDVGTRFSVAYDGKDVDVRVTEGEVKVKRGGKELRVTAGNAWTIEIGPITIAELTTRQSAIASNVVAADPPLPNPTNPTVVAQSGSGGSGGSGQGSAAKPSKSPSSNAKKALENFPVEPLVQASSKDPQAAIIEYLEQSKTMPEGEDKAELIQSIAVMQLREKNNSAALHTIKGLLDRQGGPAYQSALWLDMRVKCLTSYDRDANRDGKPDRSFDDDCRRSSERYLVKFPSGAAAGVAQEVLNEISRGQ
ncbi:MAG TPA: FecR family protein [Kofleriaceae bacterium]